MINLSNYYLIVVLAPLVSSIILGLFGTGFVYDFINKKYASLIAISGILIAFLFSCIIFYHVLNYGDIDINLYNWNIISNTTFNIGFLIDILSSIMMIIITFISLMVHIYTIGYMYKDDGYQRFFCYISLFTFSMLMLVMSNNMVQLFFGWEAVGLVSYLLIGFWHYKPTAVHANLKAFLINRVGDFGLLLGIILIFINTDSFYYKDILNNASYIAANNKIFILSYEFSVIKLACWLLFMGAMAKSAQIPLHSWLPDSMEGPTPISALIHAATMVTAGIFLVVRLYILFEFSDELLSFITIIGSLSALFMGILGIVQNDIKKIIAYSTLSQLGYMMVAIGISAYPIAIFHLLTHAFFKALLFLCAGSVIIGMHHDQNIKNMGGLYKYMPITCITFLIGSLSLIGIPFFSGFYSKEILIEAIKYSSIYGANFAYYATNLGILITSIYSLRLYIIVFHGKENFRSINSNIPHESKWSITLPLVLLSIPSIFLGFFLVDDFILNSNINSYKHQTMNLLKSTWLGNVKFAIHAIHEIQFYLIILGLLIVLCKYNYIKNKSMNLFSIKKLHILNKILKNGYYFDWLNEKILVPFFIKIGNIFYKIFDQKIIDGFFVNGNIVLVRYFYMFLSKLHSGYIYHYAFFMIAGIAIILSVLLIK
nr:NADH-quinone oxidoreductase subunit L [Candidatus Kinetoplastibacterium sorsogonicusi]